MTTVEAMTWNVENLFRPPLGVGRGGLRALREEARAPPPSDRGAFPGCRGAAGGWRRGATTEPPGSSRWHIPPPRRLCLPRRPRNKGGVPLTACYSGAYRPG